MRIPPTGYLTLALLCGELVCVIVWAFTGILSVLIVGIAAGVGCVVAAMRWKDSERGCARPWIPVVAVVIRARRLCFAPLLHAWRKGFRVGARASGRRSRARVHGGRRSRRSYVVRAPLPVLRNTDRLSSAAAQDPAGDHARYHASRDDRSESISYGIAHSLPDRLTLRFCDCVAVRAFQHAPPFGLRLSPRRLPEVGCFSAFQQVVSEPPHKRRIYRRKQRFLGAA